ncbi:MAG: enoyl-CoA hydratase/isomerase family protein, partial [Gammaproteobacteria bacterium]
PEEVLPRAIAKAEALAALPPEAMATTRALARADLIALFDDPEIESPDAVNEVWFGTETQAAMRALVASLAARRKQAER